MTPGVNRTLVALIAEGLADRHTNDRVWPPGAKNWATLQQAITLLKAKGMKLAVGMGELSLYLEQPLLPGSRNLLLEGYPAGWRPYLIPLLWQSRGTPYLR